MARIPALTVWEPWASLIILGAKPYEFRGHQAPRAHQGKRIGIHAGARPPKREEIRELLARLNSANAWTTCLIPEKAIPILEGFLRQAPATRSHMLGTALLGVPKLGADIVAEFGGVINDSDRHEHSNWAWPMTEVERFEPPIPAKGAQGFWYWTGGQA